MNQPQLTKDKNKEEKLLDKVARKAEKQLLKEMKLQVKEKKLKEKLIKQKEKEEKHRERDERHRLRQSHSQNENQNTMKHNTLKTQTDSLISTSQRVTEPKKIMAPTDYTQNNATSPIPCINDNMIPHQWEKEYKMGRLNDVIQFLTQKGLKQSDYLKSGSTCIVFHYGSKHVLKLTAKTICYFRHFGSSVSHFQNLISNQFNGCFLPMSQIIYEDDNYFVYIQDKLTILDLPQINEKIYCKILEIIKKMCVSKIITPDIISCNLGFPQHESYQNKSIEDSMLLLDYHDLTPFDIFVKKQKWTKIFNCLLNFASFMIYHKSFEDQFKESLSLWKDENRIKKRNFASEYFPSHIVDVWKALSSGQIDQIQKTITLCQQKLKQ